MPPALSSSQSVALFAALHTLPSHSCSVPISSPSSTSTSCLVSEIWSMLPVLFSFEMYIAWQCSCWMDDHYLISVQRTSGPSKLMHTPDHHHQHCSDERQHHYHWIIVKIIIHRTSAKSSTKSLTAVQCSALDKLGFDATQVKRWSVIKPKLCLVSS